MRRAVRRRPLRWLSVPFTPAMLSIAGYRMSRMMHLALGRRWGVLHSLLWPLRALGRPFGAGLEIHYRADVGPGLGVLHPTLGAVVSAHAVCGKNLVLAGGNCIGARPGTAEEGLIIGDGVTLGINASILGPARVGDKVYVGANSVLIGDAPAGATVTGVPARPLADTGRSPS